MRSFSNETLKFFLQSSGPPKFWRSDLPFMISEIMEFLTKILQFYDNNTPILFLFYINKNRQ